MGMVSGVLVLMGFAKVCFFMIFGPFFWPFFVLQHEPFLLTRVPSLARQQECYTNDKTVFYLQLRTMPAKRMPCCTFSATACMKSMEKTNPVGHERLIGFRGTRRPLCMRWLTLQDALKAFPFWHTCFHSYQTFAFVTPVVTFQLPGSGSYSPSVISMPR